MSRVIYVKLEDEKQFDSLVGTIIGCKYLRPIDMSSYVTINNTVQNAKDAKR